MGSGAVIALIENLITRTKGLNNIYDLINGRLTPTRALYLDRLQHLSSAISPVGDVALQADLGTPADAPGFTTSVFAAVRQLDIDVESLLTLINNIGGTGVNPAVPVLLNATTAQGSQRWIDPASRSGTPAYVSIPAPIPGPTFGSSPLYPWSPALPMIESYTSVFGLPIGFAFAELRFNAVAGGASSVPVPSGTPGSLRLTKASGTALGADTAPPYFLFDAAGLHYDFGLGAGLQSPGIAAYGSAGIGDFAWYQTYSTAPGMVDMWINGAPAGISFPISVARGPYYFHLSANAPYYSFYSTYSVLPSQYGLYNR